MRLRGVPTVADWKATVYQHRAEGLGNGVRVLLLFLADNMKANRMVSVPRSQIAAALGVSTAEVTKRIKAARDAGLLYSVRQGRPGVTAVYQGLFPSLSVGNPGVTKPEAAHGTGNHTSISASLGNPGVAATVKRGARETVGGSSAAEGSTSTLTRRAMQCTEEEDPEEGVAPARSAGGETAEGGSVVSSADRANRKALIDALQDYVRVDMAWRAGELSTDELISFVNDDSILWSLLDEVEDGLGAWAINYWTFPRNCATSRYAAGTQLNKLINTYRSEAA